MRAYRRLCSCSLCMRVLPLLLTCTCPVANYQPLGDAPEHVCPAEAFSQTGVRFVADGPDVWGGMARWCSQRAQRHAAGGAADDSCCLYDPCRLLGSSSGGATELSYARTLQVCAARTTLQPNSRPWLPSSLSLVIYAHV
jgi:hypothetical protein